MPSVFNARFSCPINSSMPTAEFSPDMPKWTGKLPTFSFHTGMTLAPISTPV